MGQKVNPKGIRLGIVKDWDSKWYANSQDYSKYLLSDIEVRDFLFEKLKSASVSRIQIERLADNAKVIIHTARPGIVIGKKGADIEDLKAIVAKIMGIPVHISIEEIKKPELDARLVAETTSGFNLPSSHATSAHSLQANFTKTNLVTRCKTAVATFHHFSKFCTFRL
jgi:small subunit ribosomal protein S3